MRGHLEHLEQFEIERTNDSLGLVEQGLPDLSLMAQVDSSADLQSASPVLPELGTKSWRWLLLALCSAVGGITAFAFVWLTSIPAVTNCQRISPLSPDIERLSCAQEAAKSGKLPELMAGLRLVEEWTPEHPLYHQAEQWMAEWSQS
ncbi:MAG: hypothetical protein WCA35_00705, partial [Kovacikia sp.]